MDSTSLTSASRENLVCLDEVALLDNSGAEVIEEGGDQLHQLGKLSAIGLVTIKTG
jgi:hypothetical protein